MGNSPHQAGRELATVAGGTTELSTLVESAKAYAYESVAANTRRGYQSDWRNFREWCKATAQTSLPSSSQTVALYLTHLADIGRSHKTIVRRCAAIRWVHDQHRLPNPCADPAIRTIMRGIGRKIGRASRRQKAAATVDDVLALMIAGLPDDPRGIRDKAVLLLGFSGAFRRSELASLRIENIAIRDEGAIVTLHRSKTDQSGKGAEVAVPRGQLPALCPVRALVDWLDLLEKSGCREGYLVRGIHRGGKLLEGGNTDRTVCRIVKQAARRAGLDPNRFGAHSLRSGLATQAAMKGKNVMQIAGHGRWKKIETVLGYYRAGTRFDENAAKGIGL